MASLLKPDAKTTQSVNHNINTRVLNCFKKKIGSVSEGSVQLYSFQWAHVATGDFAMFDANEFDDGLGTSGIIKVNIPAQAWHSGGKDSGYE